VGAAEDYVVCTGLKKWKQACAHCRFS
jgi:hypothetical protein